MTIAVTGLAKTYGKNIALENVSFEIGRSLCVGLVGPNGAGKTTLIKIIAGLLKPTSGRVEVFGCNPFDAEVKPKVGYMPEKPELFEDKTAKYHIDFVARLRGIKSNSRILSELGLDKSKKVRVFSKGMRKKLSLALATLHNPDLLLLDEPTAGLDPQAAIILHEIVRKTVEGGKTVLISSHNLYEIEDLCDEIIFLNRIIRFKGPMSNFDPILKIQTGDNQKAIELLNEKGIKSEVSGKWVVTETDDTEVIEILAKEVNIIKMETHRSLYEVFEDLQ